MQFESFHLKFMDNRKSFIFVFDNKAITINFKVAGNSFHHFPSATLYETIFIPLFFIKSNNTGIDHTNTQSLVEKLWLSSWLICQHNNITTLIFTLF